jgi:PAS domain S-box-containing protein
MIIQDFKSFLVKHILMTSNLLVGGLLCLYLDVYYLQTHQNYYLDLLQALVACEVLVMSFYLGLKLRKTKLNVTSLKAEEERLKLFTQIMEEAILIRDGETVVEVNDVSARMLGYEISEMIGRNIYQFMAPQSAEENKLWIKKGYPSDNFELTAKRKDGTTFPILVHGRNITYKGRPMRLSCGWDITELKNMQEAVQKSEGQV